MGVGVTLRCIETLCEPGDKFHPNEDAVWHNGSAAVVLDGATGFAEDHFTDGATDASWLVQQVVKDLDLGPIGDDFADRLQRALDVTAQQLNKTIGCSIEPDHEPMAALGAVHVHDGVLRYWLIGDISLLVCGSDGLLTTYIDPRPQECELSVLREWTRLALERVPYKDRRELIRPLIRKNRRAVNTPTGYAMYTRHSTGLASSISGSLPACPGVRFCLMSDGFARASLLFRVNQNNHTCTTGTALRESLIWMRQQEMLDPDGFTWPRIKIHDDASAILMEIPLYKKTSEQLSQYHAQRFPVSIKGIVHFDGSIALLKNERDEWELPGGKLESHEQPEQCVVREIAEELGIAVTVDKIIDSWVYDVLGQVKVLIVTYLCHPCERLTVARLSHEHKELALVSVNQLSAITMPEGYRRSIVKALLPKTSVTMDVDLEN